MKTPSEIGQLLGKDRRVSHFFCDVDGGTFLLRLGTAKLRVIMSWAMDWDHVSVSCQHRVPRYEEMKIVKRLLFRRDEWVVEYHPPTADYISVNDNVLHMWRPQKEALPTPPAFMV